MREVRKDGLSIAKRSAIMHWWDFESRVSLNKKDVTRQRIGPGMYIEKATHNLQET